MKRMVSSNTLSFLLFFLFALVHHVHNLDYSDLEVLGLNCPQRDNCQVYRNDLTYLERSCECDNECQLYNDCCIDATRKISKSQPVFGNEWTCMRYGEKRFAGVYVIGTCSSIWNGSSQVQQKCEGPVDFTDPLLAAPVTSIEHGVTYRNRYCAECNDAELSSLMTFQLRMACQGLEALAADQVLLEMTYDTNRRSWVVNRLNSFGNGTNFIGCNIIFDIPDYLNNSLRFCRSDLISTCPPTWTHTAVRHACSEYMAVVFDNNFAYRNPHCAICNGRTIEELSCNTDVLGRKMSMSFPHLLDINQADGNLVGKKTVNTPKCSPNHIYDSIAKKCRPLVCLPGYSLKDGKCFKN